MKNKKKTLFCAAPVIAALAIAGCGGGGGGGGAQAGGAATGGGAYGGSGGSSASKTASPSAPGGAGAQAAITVRHDKLGSYLADARGRALYLFEADTGTTSSCYSACASVWPPLKSASPSAGVTRTLLGTTKRKDGTAEVTYGGHPLYLYAGDTTAGAVNGQGLNQFGAKWYLVAPTGKKIDNDEH
jgi:predicted lipoprotein with Yx(FWY)xxD motif